MRERLKSIRVSIKCKLSQKEVYGNMPSRYMIVTLNLEQDYLAHHGIKGQKWGVRRFQNPDGTLTAAGKRRLKPLSDYETISRKNSERLYSEAEKIKRTNESMHQRYDGKDGWKHYAEDAYPNSTAEDYGMSEKDFKKWMSSELASNMALSDAQDKNDYEKYYNAAKAWEDTALKLKNVDISSISSNDIKAAKRSVALYKSLEFVSDGFSLDDLANQIGDKKRG